MQLTTREFIRIEHTLQGRPIWSSMTPLAGGTVAGLYIHIPFCFHRCHYCDFYSVVDPGDPARDRQQAFTTALIAEIVDRSGRLVCRPDSIFVGGGTPTLLRPGLWVELLACLHSQGLLERVTEFTVEANPETVTAELAGVLAQGGVTRVSIGAQSFNPAHLKMLERWHDPANVARAVDHFRGAGVGRINLDLIFAIPGQTLDDFASDLDSAIALGVEHISCYALTYEPNTQMTTRLHKGRFQPCDQEAEAGMYNLALDRLAEAGYEQYEISAWAKPGEQCRHNLHYWRNDHYLGVGPGAASHLSGHRWKNKPHLEQYTTLSPQHPVVDYEHLDEPGRAGEALMMGLRLREGVDSDWLTQNFSERDGDISELTAQGFMEPHGSRTRLTRKGLLVADSILSRLLF